jgi:hypothetical protein
MLPFAIKPVDLTAISLLPFEFRHQATNHPFSNRRFHRRPALRRSEGPQLILSPSPCHKLVVFAGSHPRQVFLLVDINGRVFEDKGWGFEIAPIRVLCPLVEPSDGAVRVQIQ